ncbi:MAG TPA: endonuclease MutS2 [Spirochaetota bacterium]|nr:endonuclease MutS2 [Spirochaetota bacterium]
MDSFPIEKVFSILEWDTLRGHLEECCATPLGRGYAREMPFFTEIPAISVQLGKITQIKALIEQDERPSFRGLSDIAPLAERAVRDSVLSLAELFQVREFAIATDRVRDFFAAHLESCPLLSDELAALHDTSGLRKELASSITDAQEINAARFPAIGRLTERIRATRSEIENRLHGIIHSPAGARYIQERTHAIRNDRYVLLVKSSMRTAITGTVHDISASGATVYLEPQAVHELNNRLIAAELDLQVELHRILVQLTAAVKGAYDALTANLTVLAYLEFLHAASCFSVAIGGSAPRIAETPLLRLYRARHPLLYLMETDKSRIISNDIFLGTDYSCLIITGANTGGKTVLLKTAGLCALMARCGLHIPADPDSEIGVFGSILVDIGDDQSIAESLSTYSGQIVMIRSMLEAARADTLALIDEIIVGTNPRQGASLARAVLEGLIDTGAKIIVTTHYNELKSLPAQDARFQNASVSFDLETLRPTYRLTIGIPGISYATEIARMYGIPERVLARARELIDDSDRSHDAVLERIQRYEEELTRDRETVGRLRDDLARQHRDIETARAELARLREEMKSEKGVAFLEELDGYRARVLERMRELQQAGAGETAGIKREIDEIHEAVTGSVRDTVRGIQRNARTPLDPARARIGDSVYALTLGATGTISRIDRDAGTAELLMGKSLKATVPLSELCATPHDHTKKKTRQAPPPTTTAQESDAERTPLTVQTSYNTIDLRGKRVDEALSTLNNRLDEMARHGIDAVVIIHGHGTGAMKEAVRGALPASPYVQSFRAGRSGEGGDGVTIACIAI